jgi:hypothetical protein
MKIERKIIELTDFIVTIVVRPKNPPKVDNDNEPYHFWNEELKELYDDYD